MIVATGHLNYCCLSVIAEQSAHSLLSDINKDFVPCKSCMGQKLHGATLSRTFSVNLRNGCVRKARQGVSAILFPIMMLGLNSIKSSSPCPNVVMYHI